MDDALIDGDTIPRPRKSLIPGEGFFVPDSVEEEQEEKEARETLAGAEVVVVADPDADGLACVALVREALGEAALLPAGPHDLDDAVERVAEYAEDGVRVFVCDLCPDRYEQVGDAVESLVGFASDVSWYDHHQWDDDVAERIREQGVDLVVGDSEAECTADVTLRSLDHEFADRWADLAAVTRDHDLWLREDPRSDDLADYSYWVDPEEYIATVREHGADLPPEVQEFLAEQRVEKEDLIERAVARTEYEEVGPWTVGVTYGRCSQNEVAEAMRQDGADASVVVKPAGSASIRGTETFKRCHEVARQVDGGGHPKAAGCKPDVYDDMLDYARHWTTEGQVAKHTILQAFENLLPADYAEGDDVPHETPADAE